MHSHMNGGLAKILYPKHSEPVADNIQYNAISTEMKHFKTMHLFALYVLMCLCCLKHQWTIMMLLLRSQIPEDVGEKNLLWSHEFKPLKAQGWTHYCYILSSPCNISLQTSKESVIVCSHFHLMLKVKWICIKNVLFKREFLAIQSFFQFFQSKSLSFFFFFAQAWISIYSSVILYLVTGQSNNGGWTWCPLSFNQALIID